MSHRPAPSRRRGRAAARSRTDRLLGWIAEGDLEVVVWRTDEETPVLVSLVVINESPPHAVTFQVKDTEEGEPG